MFFFSNSYFLPEISFKALIKYSNSAHELPMLDRIEVNEENIVGFLGDENIEYESALASEPMMGSIAHSVVLVRTKDGADIEGIKTKIKEKVDPRKWICVEAENVYVESKGDLVILIMSGDIADDIKENFENLK